MRGRRFALAAAGVLAASAALPAQAQPLAALTAHDVALYAQAFAAAERGDVAAADQAVAQVGDQCLAGEVQYVELTHARARSATYDELNRWLKAFGDLPGATQLYELALKLHPADALPPPAATSVLAADIAIRMRPAPQSRPAREAYFDGDVRRALQLARSSGDAWIAGLAAYRLGQYADAMISFETLAANDAEDDPTRAAGGFWAARSAVFAGLPDRATPLLKIAAAKADTFYGMIAKRKLELSDDPLGRLIDTASNGKIPTPLAATVSAGSDESPLDRLVRTDPRAHRAIALAQLSRQADAGAELRAGFAEATDDATRALWLNLTFELGPTRPPTGEIVLSASAPVSGSYAAYPTPNLAPAGGFTIDKALVYAVVWQESRFNSLAVSPVGAVGLMQLMPPSAASMAGDATLTGDPIHLFDTGRNLQLGQAYIRWLEENAGNHDLLRTIAAYNGGPTTLVRTENLLGPNADSLLVIESVPFAETRAYVRKVVAAYWSYRRQFGAPAKTLDAAASDLMNVDARLDGPAAPSAPVENAQGPAPAPSQSLEIMLHHNG
jgi:soluble lytic murein transglycosylase-like protein